MVRSKKTLRCVVPFKRPSTRHQPCRLRSALKVCGAPMVLLPLKAVFGLQRPAQKTTAVEMQKPPKTMAAEAGYDGTADQVHGLDQLSVPLRQRDRLHQAIGAGRASTSTFRSMIGRHLIEKRAQPDQWDLFFTHHGFVPDPILISVMNDNYPGWWATPEKKALKDRFHCVLGSS